MNLKLSLKLFYKIPGNYPLTPIEIALPELDGKTEKMYRGGKICIDIHFAPLWQKNVPHYGMPKNWNFNWISFKLPDKV